MQLKQELIEGIMSLKESIRNYSAAGEVELRDLERRLIMLEIELAKCIVNEYNEEKAA